MRRGQAGRLRLAREFAGRRGNGRRLRAVGGCGGASYIRRDSLLGVWLPGTFDEYKLEIDVLLWFPTPG